MSFYRVDGKQIETEVFLNVYDLNPSFNSSCYGMGLGFYHSGIEINSTEYTFGGHEGQGTGVMEVSPKVNHPNFRESVLLGRTAASSREVQKIVDELKEKFEGKSYHVIRKNCNTFTNAVCEALLKKKIPGWVNRLANMGKAMIEIQDFVMIRPYDPMYEVCPNKLGVQGVKDKNPFGTGKGIAIG